METRFSLLQDPAQSDLAVVDSNDWRFDLTAWVWLVGGDGKVGARGVRSDVSATFIDVLDATESAWLFSGRLEVGTGPWGVFIDSTYIRLGADDQSGPIPGASIDVRSEQFMMDFGLMYRVGEWEHAESTRSFRPNTTLDLYAGGRYSHLELELRPANFPRASRSHDWVDPIVGARLKLPVGDRWQAVVSGDIGGFGVASDLTWSVTAVLGYDFTLFNTNATLYAGYRAIGWEYSDGSGTNEFIYDVTLHGPIIGLSFAF